MSTARLNWLTSQWACTQAAEPVLHASLSKGSFARDLAHLLTQSAYHRGQPQRQRQLPDHYWQVPEALMRLTAATSRVVTQHFATPLSASLLAATFYSTDPQHRLSERRSRHTARGGQAPSLYSPCVMPAPSTGRCGGLLLAPYAPRSHAVPTCL